MPPTQDHYLLSSGSLLMETSSLTMHSSELPISPGTWLGTIYRLDDGSEVYTGNQKPEGRMSASRAQRGRYTARGFLISRIHLGNPSSNLFIPWQRINRVLSNPQPSHAMVSTATNSAAHMSLLLARE